MTDLLPLRSLERDEFEVSLLRSADADTPAPDAVKKAALALGVPTALLSATSTASATAGVVTAGIGKSFAIGLIAGALLSGGVAGARLYLEPSPAPQRLGASHGTGAQPPVAAKALPPTFAAPPAEVRDPAPPAPGATAPSKPRQPLAEPLAPEAPAPALAPAVATFEVSEASTSAPALSALPPTPSAVAPSLALEIAELDRARTLLAAGQARPAIVVLDGYTARFPSGVLALEAGLLRVEAELARGNRAAAERLGGEIVQRHPGTRYARKVTSLLSGGRTQ